MDVDKNPLRIQALSKGCLSQLQPTVFASQDLSEPNVINIPICNLSDVDADDAFIARHCKRSDTSVLNTPAFHGNVEAISSVLVDNISLEASKDNGERLIRLRSHLRDLCSDMNSFVTSKDIGNHERHVITPQIIMRALDLDVLFDGPGDGSCLFSAIAAAQSFLSDPQEMMKLSENEEHLKKTIMDMKRKVADIWKKKTYAEPISMRETMCTQFLSDRNMPVYYLSNYVDSPNPDAQMDVTSMDTAPTTNSVITLSSPTESRSSTSYSLRTFKLFAQSVESVYRGQEMPMPEILLKRSEDSTLCKVWKNVLVRHGVVKSVAEASFKKEYNNVPSDAEINLVIDVGSNMRTFLYWLNSSDETCLLNAELCKKLDGSDLSGIIMPMGYCHTSVMGGELEMSYIAQSTNTAIVCLDCDSPLALSKWQISSHDETTNTTKRNPLYVRPASVLGLLTYTKVYLPTIADAPQKHPSSAHFAPPLMSLSAQSCHPRDVPYIVVLRKEEHYMALRINNTSFPTMNLFLRCKAAFSRYNDALSYFTDTAVACKKHESEFRTDEKLLPLQRKHNALLANIANHMKQCLCTLISSLTVLHRRW